MKVAWNRKYCFVCSPWGQRNNQTLEDLRTDGKKTCRKCGLDKPKDEMSSDGSLLCRPCAATSQREKRRVMKAQCVAYKGGKCVDCGYSRCLAALDFHHLDPTEKDFEIGSQAIRMGFERAQPELDKCVLVCRNCHAERHFHSS